MDPQSKKQTTGTYVGMLAFGRTDPAVVLGVRGSVFKVWLEQSL